MWLFDKYWHFSYLEGNTVFDDFFLTLLPLYYYFKFVSYLLFSATCLNYLGKKGAEEDPEAK